MSTFEYLTPDEALDAARADAPDHQKIIGLKGVDADRMPTLITRTDSGYARKPAAPWRAHGYLDKFKEIEGLERVSGDVDPGAIEVHFTDGTSAYLHRVDLLCVERPVLGTGEGMGK